MYFQDKALARGESRTATTSKMKHFVIVVNGLQPLTIIKKYSILDVAAVLDRLWPATTIEALLILLFDGKQTRKIVFDRRLLNLELCCNLLVFHLC